MNDITRYLELFIRNNLKIHVCLSFFIIKINNDNNNVAPKNKYFENYSI